MGLELKGRDRVRVLTEMVAFIALPRGVLYDFLGVDMDLWDGTLEPLAYTTTTATSITILYKCYRLK